MIELELLLVLVLVLQAFFLQFLLDLADLVLVDGFQLSLSFEVLPAQSFHSLDDLFLNESAFAITGRVLDGETFQA